MAQTAETANLSYTFLTIAVPVTNTLASLALDTKNHITHPVEEG
jgi:hypothetical protein